MKEGMRTTILFLIMGIFGSYASAQNVWTIERALQHARENNLEILQARLGIQRAQVDLKAIRQQRIPSLSFSSNLSNSIGRTIDPTTNAFTTENNYNQSANINSGVQLFNGGLVHKQVRQAQFAEQQAMLQVAETEEDIQLLVVQQFFQVMFTKENVALSEANMQLLVEQQNRIAAEVNAGSKPQNELLEIQAEVARSEQQVIAADNQYNLAVLQFKQLLRIPVEEQIEFQLPPVADVLPNELDLLSIPELRDRALAMAPSLQAAELRVESASLGIQMAKSQYYPRLSLGGSLSTNFSTARRMSIPTGSTISNQTVYLDGNPVTVGFESPTFRLDPIPYADQLNENWGLGFGLQLTIPIYTQGNTSANVQQARINYQSAQLQKEQQVNMYTEELERNIADLKSSYRSYLAAEKTLEASTRFFNNIELSYNVGASTSFELINAQNRKEEAQTNFLISKYEYLARKRGLMIYLKYETLE